MAGSHDLGADGSRGLGSGGLLLQGSLEASLGGLHNSGEALLGDATGIADSHEHELAHLSTGFLGVELEPLDLLGSTRLLLGDGGRDAHVEGSLGLLVHVLQLHLGLGHAGLALAASSILLLVGRDDTSEVVHLLLELAVVVGNVLVEATHALVEVGLRIAEGVGNVEAGLGQLGIELLVLRHLLLLGLGNSRVQGSGLLGKHLGSMCTVLLHGGTHLVELSSVVGSHGLHASIVSSLVLLDEGVQLLVLLKVLLVAFVTDLDHASHLGLHIGVDLGLGELVLLDLARQSSDASVGCRDLTLHGGTKQQNAGLEVGLGLLHALGSLLLCLGNVLGVLGEALGLQSLLSIEGGSHTTSGSLEGNVSMVTVLGHLFAHTAELGRSLLHDDLELVVSPLTDVLVLGLELDSELGTTLLGLLASSVGLLVELVHGCAEGITSSLGRSLDLGSVLGHMLVGGLDASVHGRAKGSHGVLLGGDSGLQLGSSELLVLLDPDTEPLLLGLVGLLAPVGKSSGLGEFVLNEAHGTSEVTLGLLGVLLHLVEQHLLQAGTGSLVESHVTVHLLANSLHVTLACGLLGSDLLLDVGQVIDQTHAAVGSVGEDGSCLLHILGGDRLWPVTVERVSSSSLLGHVLHSIAGISRDVHHRAANGQAAEQGESNAGTVHLFSRHHSSAIPH